MKNISEFFNEIHPLTLQYFEAELMPKLERIDKLNWMQTSIDEIKAMEAYPNAN